MRITPSEQDQKISPVFIIAYFAFLLIPCFAFYKGLHNHSIIAVLGAGFAILGFSFLIITSIRHNKRIRKRDRSGH